MSKFLAIWFGQTVSLVGSGLTSFALGIWVYQQTGSIMNFGLISLLIALPGLVASPLSGVVVDRCNRRTVMLLSDLAEGACILALAILFFTHQLHLLEVYLLVALGSVAGAFRIPAYMALMSQMVETSQVGRASGLMQFGPAAAQILAPVLAGALIGTIRFHGIFLLDAVTFLFAIIVLLTINVPSLSLPPEKAGRAGTSLLKEAMEGWAYILARPGLRGLLVFFGILNITYNFSEILLVPMILGFAGTATLGKIMSTGAAGFVAGGFLVSIWGGPRRRVYGLLGFGLIYAAGLVLSGVRPSPAIVSLAIFVTLFSVPVINTCSQAIWQTKTKQEIQGRIFAARMMIVSLSSPVAFFLAAPLADHFFEPFMKPGSRFAQIWSPLVGAGPGRGFGLFLVLNGFVALLFAGSCFINRRLWHVEDELKDVESRQFSGVTVS